MAARDDRRRRRLDTLAKRLWDNIYRVVGFLAALAAIIGLLIVVIPAGDGARDVRIDVAGSRVDPSGTDMAAAEYVCLVNAEDRGVSLAGWQLRDAERLVNVLPQFELAAHASVRVHAGRGRDTRTDLYGTRSQPVWNNDADTITLLDEHGRTVAQVSYGVQAARATGRCGPAPST